MNTDDDSPWGVCADVTGLYADPPRRSYELLGCAPTGPFLDAMRAVSAAGAGAGAGAGAARLGDIWLRPEADDRCPAGSERLDAWRLLDVRVTGSRRNPADAERWDITVDGVEDFYGEPEDPYLAAGVSLHDERTWLGHCRDLSVVLPPDDEPSGPPFQLLGCAPGATLGAVLSTGTRRSLFLDEAELRILDHTGTELTDRLVSGLHISGWRPSALGDGLLDIDLTRAPYPQIPTWARPLWTRWLTGPPIAPNLWAAYPAREREQWLDIVRERGCRLSGHAPDRPPGRVYDLDGRHISDETGLYCALGEAINGPGGYFGGCRNALSDCLSGRFGATTPFTLRWHHSHVARHHLSHRLSPDGTPYNCFEELVAVLEERRVEVVLR
ncbi:barstar family protein [Streptomyces sp. NPDC059788]|uniref:barstar family protein n=1 Tax=Streptomyces sp. NPDC059788 TaxID=3346948 RepID=UPI003658EBCE